ncbi:hypothetical protein VCUG_02405 [Vavraia culicis subsp. floridensis]|uniref:Uncharacterized protein n=1 Tax=Vavraia culicis (isolate floridensis) TaxID=948595 RepID=L2GRU0_VAVCU|nr:uncharacterized protein VCUG_02405 [Vavraia culicis subsp. floridensis]ELA46097.1 hypothetical protein VCUG_02405 [Vavraia culicis subsp. floridensis]
MKTEHLISVKERMVYITLFCIQSLVEIVFFGLSLYFESNMKRNSLYTVKGSTLLLGNLFLIEAIMLKNPNHIYLYAIIYAYTLSSAFLGEAKEPGLSLAFRTAVVGTLLLRGLMVCILFRKIRQVFVWYSFKKLGPSTELIGKFIF